MLAIAIGSNFSRVTLKKIRDNWRAYPAPAYFPRPGMSTQVSADGAWEFLETPELKQAKQEIRRLNGAPDLRSKPFPGQETLTPKERVAPAQIIRGFSSKEAGRKLGIGPRTVDFHRAKSIEKTRRQERRRARA
jgi:FixJ family two-component response regulator